MISVKFNARYLDDWNKRMLQPDSNGMYDKVIYAYLKQNKFPVKHTNEYRNIYTPSMLQESLDRYDSIPNVEFDSHQNFGYRMAHATFARPEQSQKLSIKEIFDNKSIKQIIAELSIKDKSSGLTAYGQSKFESMERSLAIIPKILQNGKSPAPCLATYRTQANNKTRLVWSYPAEMTVMEAIVARPLIEMYLKEIDHPMTFGKSAATTGARIRRASGRNNIHYSMDYSKFDTTCNSYEIKRAFTAFRTWFEMNEEVLPGVTVDKLFKTIENYFLHSGIVMPSEKGPSLHLGRKGGIPSGSYFTQMVGSFINFANIMSVSHKFNLGLKQQDVFVLGDDCMFFSKGTIPYEKISNYLKTRGFNVHPDKGSRGEVREVEYLGRHWSNGIPKRTYRDAISRALYPERVRIYSKDYAQRMYEAKLVLHSYQLTADLVDIPDNWSKILDASGNVDLREDLSSGFTKYLISEGLLGNSVSIGIY